MRKVVKTIITILLFIISILLQLFVFNNITLFGFKPNMLIISVILVGMYTNIYSTAFYALLLGFTTDLLFGTSGFYTVIYSILGVVIGYVSDNYMKENIFSAIILTAGGITILEIIEYIRAMAISANYIGFMHFVGDLLVSVLLNVAIASVFAFVLGKINALLEKKQDNIYW